MIILGIETATERLSAALIVNGSVSERYSDSRSSHCELLAGFIGELVEEFDIGYDKIEGIAVSVGPGSFTGLRIGIATAMGLAYALGIKTAGVGTLTALTWNIAEPGTLVCPLIDAKRSEAYAAVFRSTGDGIPDTVMEPQAVPALRLSAKLASFGEPVLITGPGVDRFRRVLEKDGDFTFVDPTQAKPSAVSVAEIGNRIFYKGGAVSPAALKPLYLRRSDAEILKEKKCGG